MAVKVEWVRAEEMKSGETVGSRSKRVLSKIEELLDEPFCSSSEFFSPSSSPLSSFSPTALSPSAGGVCHRSCQIALPPPSGSEGDAHNRGRVTVCPHLGSKESK